MLPAFFFVYIIFLLCFFRVAAVVRVYRGRRTVCMTAVVRAGGGRRGWEEMGKEEWGGV